MQPAPLQIESFVPGRRRQSPGDLWGGLAAMLVALPTSIAFGVIVYSAIGPAHAAYGALAGVIGATVIGLVASTMGGTDRLISSPCAPAAAILSAFAIELTHKGIAPGTIVLLLILLGILTGAIQMILGFVGVGRLIKYIPYHVVSGFSTSVGILMVCSQIPKFFGSPEGTRWWQALLSPGSADWRSLLIGGVTALVTVLAPRFIRRVPGVILGILSGILVYFALAAQNPALLELSNNPLVIGPLGNVGTDYLNSLNERWHEIGDLRVGQVASLIGSALTLAVLLSIDTLKTCVVLDQITHRTHDSNRELVGQGLANIASCAVGGLPGAGTTGATMVALNSGAETRAASILEGIFALVATIILSSFIAWIPVATLAGVLIVIGFRMIDRYPFRFLESRATVFDFVVVLSVVLVAITVGLIAAAATGVEMAILLFVREQIGGAIIRRKVYLNQTSSTWYRPATEMRALEEKGGQAVIFELQGSLFFGNARQLYADLESEIAKRQYVILSFRKIQSIDVTAAQLLNHVRDAILERGGVLVLCEIPGVLPNGRDLGAFLEQTGLLGRDNASLKQFADLDGAIAWVEDRILGDSEHVHTEETLLQLQEMEIFAGRKEATIKDLEASMQQRSYKAGETLYAAGEAGDEIFWVRRGAVKIVAQVGAGQLRRIASFSRGDFFGSISFLDGRRRTNDAVADMDTDVFVLSREQFNRLAEDHKKLAFDLMTAIAGTMASRLRQEETEVTMLQTF